MDDFGLILKIPKIIQDLITYDNLCSHLFKLWDIICKEMNLNEKDIINNFTLFISALIKRRNNNINKWIEEITKNFHNLKDLKNQNSPLDNKWIICQEQCKFCYFKCTLLHGHDKEHKCPYDHKCKEKCSICIKCNCSNKECSQMCEEKSGHLGEHFCKHFHQCKEMCEYNSFTNDCKGRCNLEYNHTENHKCEVREHHCKESCYLDGKAKNCGKKCKLIYPHEGIEHNCENQHYCMNECFHFGKSQGCKEYCKYIYGHKENHNCGEKHICISNCYLKDKARECNGNCILEYPHEGKEHYCGKTHYCQNECFLKGKSKGCNDICSKEYGHKGDHDCSKVHYCKDICYLKGKAKNCNEECNKEYLHKGNHDCTNQHLCQKNCSLINKSINCQKECSLEYRHNGSCMCNLNEKHKCNGKCQIEKDCNRKCILDSNHEGNCLCGSCNCQENCEYNDYSRNCNGKCKLKAGHKEKNHLCGETKHMCNHKCYYKEKSINCSGYCNYCLENNKNHINEILHICEKQKEMHKCKENCTYEHSRGCEKKCSKEVEHEGPHLCCIPLENHLCKDKCSFFGKSIQCMEFCNKCMTHNDEHLCNLKIEEHICKNKCSLYIKPGEKCDTNCKLIAGHEGECDCKNKHICNQICEFYNRSKNCKQFCSLPLNHKNNHICISSKEEHICLGICHLNGKTRGKCEKDCCLPIGHEEKNLKCICSKNPQHLCNKICCLYEKSIGCKKECNKRYNHKDIHLCNSTQHFCKKFCYYYEIYKKYKKGKCEKKCYLPFNHKGKCICCKEPSHPCINKCSLFEKSGGCNEECSLSYGHKEECICSVKITNHTCKEKCQLCNDNEIECGHVYNHDNNYNLNCIKCKNQTCKLSGKGHLCGIQHNCTQICEENGFCEIEGAVNVEVVETKIYKSISGDDIQYKLIKFQNKKKRNCGKKIPYNSFFHPGKHICDEKLNHKCGRQCIQCEHYCIGDFGHIGPHFCIHGNIKNSFISIKDSNDALIRKDNKFYKFKQGETVKIFICDAYCKEQGQGHIHEFSSETKIENDDVKIKEEKFDGYIYECKCSYFWKNILYFKGDFTSDEIKKFSLCNWKCKDEKHPLPEYCQLPLWHNKVVGNCIPKGYSGQWVSAQGHVFKCNHSNPIYTIFLVDKSGSMKDTYVLPISPEIKKIFPNKIGCCIEAILEYCKARNEINPREKCGLIGFNDKGSLILENIFIGEKENIKKKCLSELKPHGQTNFLNAFKEAEKIIENIKRYEFIPVIILLTDGLDSNKEQTIVHLKNVSSIFNNFLII